MKKRSIFALSTLFVASSLLTSCSGDAKVEEAESIMEEYNETAPVEEATAIEEATPINAVDLKEPTVDSVEMPVKKTEIELTTDKKKGATPKEEVKKTDKKVEAKVEEVKDATAGAPEMTFETTEFEFGEINQGDKVEHTFSFKNTGTAPLLITNARASCGCTVPEWPKEPIAPGKSGKIDVVFNSRGKSGNQNKAVTITTNITDQPQQVVYLKGKVNVPQPETTPAE